MMGMCTRTSVSKGGEVAVLSVKSELEFRPQPAGAGDARELLPNGYQLQKYTVVRAWALGSSCLRFQAE